MTIAPIAFAIAVAAATLWRWTRLRWPLRGLGIAVSGALVLYGAGVIRLGRFVALAGVGTGLWSAAFVLLGHLFWQSLDEAIAIAKRGSLVLGATVAVALVAGYRYLRDPATRPWRPESPSLRHLRRADARRGDDAPGGRRGRERGRSASRVGLTLGPEESS